MWPQFAKSMVEGQGNADSLLIAFRRDEYD